MTLLFTPNMLSSLHTPNMLSSLHTRGTLVFKESQKTSSLISRLCSSQSKADFPRRHHKPDPPPLHRPELKWEGKEQRNRGPAAAVNHRWGKSTKLLLPAALRGPQESQVTTEPASGRATGRTERAASNPRTSSSLLSEFRRLGNYAIIRHQRGKENLILLIAVIPEFVINFLGGKMTRKTQKLFHQPC